MNRASASASTNIALCKYWGKQGPGNAPATPSISLTLDALNTTTTVMLIKAGPDSLSLDGRPGTPEQTTRIREYLDEWREAGLLTGSFEVTSSNNYPTAAGLASSASGFAALATALNGLAIPKLRQSELSRWARRGSGSAARSIFGGLVAMSAGNDPVARMLCPPEDVPWGMVVAIVSAPPKETPSRHGMELSRQTSPFYRKWILTDRYQSRAMLDAISHWDLEQTGALMEQNMLAMHACMLTTVPPLMYWAPATMELFRAAREWRGQGIATWATTDAGPHVALLCQLAELERVADLARTVPGVVRVIACRPGPGAELLETV